MSEAFKRARKPAEKAHRRARILATARAMLAERVDSSTLSLSALAQESGMAKSNVYRYFESREAVLLEVLAAEWLDWHNALLDELGRLEPPAEDAVLAGVLARSAAERPALCHLVSVLPSVLEKNADVERVARFKLAGLELTRTAAAALHRVSPELSVEAHVELLRHATVFIVGAWPLSNPPPPVDALMDREPFSAMRHHFERDLARVGTLMLRGLREVG